MACCTWWRMIRPSWPSRTRTTLLLTRSAKCSASARIRFAATKGGVHLRGAVTPLILALPLPIPLALPPTLTLTLTLTLTQADAGEDEPEDMRDALWAAAVVAR